MAKLFISYSRKDSAAARKVIEALKGVGHEIWVDWEDIPPASDWMDQIKKGIEKADAFVFLISPDSVASGYCADELNHAHKNTKRIIPVVTRFVEYKDTDNIIRNLQWIFLREAEENFDEGIQKVKRAIEDDFDWVEQHTRLQNSALLWESKKEPSLLLRGTDLRRARQMLGEAEQKRKKPEPSPLQKTFIEFSNRNERRNLIISAIAALMIVILAGLTYTAIDQRNLARANEQTANEQRLLADKNAREAEENAREARENEQKANQNKELALRKAQEAERAKERAIESRNLAAAQRSAARAQIYQFRTGELYTSTLLAIDSQNTAASDEAEEILRENISLLPQPVAQMSFPDRITALGFNARGDVFISASANGSLCGWQVADGGKVFCYDSPGPISDAIFFPNENLILAGDTLGNLQFIRAVDGTSEKSITLPAGITDISMQSSGRYAAVTTEDAKVTLIDLNSRAISPFDLSGISIRFAAFSPNGAQIATGSENGFVKLWTLAKPGNPLDKAIHRGAVLALAYSPNGRYIVTGGVDGYAFVLDSQTLEKRSVCQHDDQVKDIAFNKDGKWFVTVSNDRKIRMWETETGRLLLVMSQNNFVQNVEVSDNNLWIATTGDDRTVRIWSAITGTELYQMPLKDTGTSLAFSRDGVHLVAGDQKGYVRDWNLNAIPTPLNSLQFAGVTASATYSPTGTWIAASDDRNVWLLKPSALSSQTTTPPGTSFAKSLTDVNQLVFSPTEKWFGLLSTGNQIVLYKPGQPGGVTLRPTEAVQTFIFSPDERSVFVGNSSGKLQAWDVNGREGPILEDFKTRITALAARTDLLAVGLGDQLRLFQINGTDLAELPQPASQSAIELLVFSPDGSWLASSNSAGQIQLWKRENNSFTPMGTLNRESPASMAYSPDNLYLAIGTADNVYLINTITQEENMRLPQTGTVTSVSFTPDGTTLLTASLKVLQFWDMAALLENPVTRDNIVETACGRLFEDLTPDQKATLLEDESKVICPQFVTP